MSRIENKLGNTKMKEKRKQRNKFNLFKLKRETCKEYCGFFFYYFSLFYLIEGSVKLCCMMPKCCWKMFICEACKLLKCGRLFKGKFLTYLKICIHNVHRYLQIQCIFTC